MSFVRKGDNVFLQNKKFDITGVDLNKGNIKGIVKIKPGRHTRNDEGKDFSNLNWRPGFSLGIALIFHERDLSFQR